MPCGTKGKVIKMKNIVIIPNETKDKDLAVTKKLIEVLSSRARLTAEKKLCRLLSGVEFKEDEQLYDGADFVIVLGGDGTILCAAEQCGKRNIPVMGINLGKVGFMTEIKTGEMDRAADALLSGNYKTEKRMMMKVTVEKNGLEKSSVHALNDVVIAKENASMIMIKMFSGGEKINQYKADGLIISTPTGSTGYSLSAGGPVADPLTEIFIASPICAHELHARPAVLSANKPILLRIDKALGHEASVTVDGVQREIITLGDAVRIEKSQYCLPLIKIGGQSFYDVLTEKLR